MQGAGRDTGLLGAQPRLQVLRGYEPVILGLNVFTGLVICFMLIPSALTYAELAGSGPVGRHFRSLCGHGGILYWPRLRFEVNLLRNGSLNFQPSFFICEGPGLDPEDLAIR